MEEEKGTNQEPVNQGESTATTGGETGAKPKKKKGCLIGCLVAFFLFLIVIVVIVAVLYFQGQAILEGVLERVFGSDILEMLPSDLFDN